jgi:predicted ATPase
MRSPVVVGRDGELRRLHHALEEAQAGQGGCLFVLGEAGSGKSRLLHEAQQEAARRAMTVMSGSVAPNVAAPALGVVVQALRSWTRSHPLPQAELAPFAVALHQALPEWPPPSDPPDLSDAQMRLLVVEGVLRLLLLAAGSEGAVVILDDLHDADPETFEFLHHAAPAAATERLLIVGAVRTGEGRRGESAARAVVRSGAADLLELGHLDDSAVAAMVEALLGAPAPPGLVVDLLARTDGVPLLMEEMLAAHRQGLGAT